MWSGASSTAIPTGWLLCDGTNNTPDLRDKFIVGAGSSYAVGSTGGEATHTLTVAEMPSHSHTITYPYDYGGTLGHGSRGTGGSGGAQWTYNPPTNFGSVGSNQPHENRPPYYALCFIMKQ